MAYVKEVMEAVSKRKKELKKEVNKDKKLKAEFHKDGDKVDASIERTVSKSKKKDKLKENDEKDISFRGALNTETSLTKAIRNIKQGLEVTEDLINDIVRIKEVAFEYAKFLIKNNVEVPSKVEDVLLDSEFMGEYLDLLAGFNESVRSNKKKIQLESDETSKDITIEEIFHVAEGVVEGEFYTNVLSDLLEGVEDVNDALNILKDVCSGGLDSERSYGFAYMGDNVKKFESNSEDIYSYMCENGSIEDAVKGSGCSYVSFIDHMVKGYVESVTRRVLDAFDIEC